MTTTNNMYVVLLNNKTLSPFTDLLPELQKNFPGEVFSINGSEEKGYKIQIHGLGDETHPRKFAESFVKKQETCSCLIYSS